MAVSSEYLKLRLAGDGLWQSFVYRVYTKHPCGLPALMIGGDRVPITRTDRPVTKKAVDPGDEMRFYINVFEFCHHNVALYCVKNRAQHYEQYAGVFSQGIMCSRRFWPCERIGGGLLAQASPNYSWLWMLMALAWSGPDWMGGGIWAQTRQCTLSRAQGQWRSRYFCLGGKSG